MAPPRLAPRVEAAGVTKVAGKMRPRATGAWHPGLGNESSNSSFENHGGLYPLPAPGAVKPTARSGLSRGTRQRIRKRRAQQLATVNAVQALSSLAAGGDLDSVATPFGRLATASSAQLAVLEDVRAQVAGQPIPGTEFASEAALSALLRVDSCYSSSEGGSTTGKVVPFRAGEVSLPFGQESPIDCRTLLDGEALADILDVETRMKLSCEEREANFEKGAPKTYMDPAFVHSRKAYLGFLRDLFKCGVVHLGRRPCCELGLFFVSKKNGKLSLIVDARVANSFSARLPQGRLAPLLI